MKSALATACRTGRVTKATSIDVTGERQELGINDNRIVVADYAAAFIGAFLPERLLSCLVTSESGFNGLLPIPAFACVVADLFHRLRPSARRGEDPSSLGRLATLLPGELNASRWKAQIRTGLAAVSLSSKLVYLASVLAFACLFLDWFVFESHLAKSLEKMGIDHEGGIGFSFYPVGALYLLWICLFQVVVRGANMGKKRALLPAVVSLGLAGLAVLNVLSADCSEHGCMYPGPGLLLFVLAFLLLVVGIAMHTSKNQR